MKKWILTIICIFLLTGCSVNYNLNIDKKFTENISARETDSEYFGYEISGMSLKELNDYYLKMPIPLLSNEDHFSESFDKTPGISYYSVKDLTNDSEIGLYLTGTFKNYNKYSDSNMAWYASNLSVKKDDNKMTILASNFKIFKQYINLDKITVNIKVNYFVSENNADSINGNVYTWVITRPNYSNKTIKLTYKTKLDAVNSIEKDGSLAIFALVLAGIVIIGFVVYMFIQMRFKKKNSL